MSMRFVGRRFSAMHTEGEDEDPLAGIANLFDVSVAFIVALLIALFSMLSIQGFLNPNEDFTLVKQNADGTMQIVSKEKNRIKVRKVTDKSMSGEGERLGVAYRLADGQVIYVPEGEAPPTAAAAPGR